MRIINPSFEIINRPNGHEVLRHLELCGRVCYKSEDAISDESAERLIRMMLERGHESPIEHFSVSVRIICDRGVSHEWVRHRIASFLRKAPDIAIIKIKIRQRADIYPSLFRRRGFKAL